MLEVVTQNTTYYVLQYEYSSLFCFKQVGSRTSYCDGQSADISITVVAINNYLV